MEIINTPLSDVEINPKEAEDKTYLHQIKRHNRSDCSQSNTGLCTAPEDYTKC